MKMFARLAGAALAAACFAASLGTVYAAAPPLVGHSPAIDKGLNYNNDNIGGFAIVYNLSAKGSKAIDTGDDMRAIVASALGLKADGTLPITGDLVLQTASAIDHGWFDLYKPNAAGNVYPPAIDQVVIIIAPAYNTADKLMLDDFPTVVASITEGGGGGKTSGAGHGMFVPMLTASCTSISGAMVGTTDCSQNLGSGHSPPAKLDI